MAKKKSKLTQKQRLRLKNTAIPVLAAILCGLLLGFTIVKNIDNRNRAKQSDNLVWATDNTVNVPDSLTKFLLAQNKCNHYKGNNSPKGVGLWAVYQVANDRFAKIAYGCSWNLSSYIMAVKQDQKWYLIPPTEYFADFKDAPGISSGAIPNCFQLEKYKIIKSIEPFCILADGTAKANDQN